MIPLHREFVTRVSRWFMVISSLRETFPLSGIVPGLLATHSYISYSIPLLATATPPFLETSPCEMGAAVPSSLFCGGLPKAEVFLLHSWETVESVEPGVTRLDSYLELR